MEYSKSFRLRENNNGNNNHREEKKHCLKCEPQVPYTVFEPVLLFRIEVDAKKNDTRENMQIRLTHQIDIEKMKV